MGPRRGWNSIYKTWMALRRHLDGVEKIILWPGLGWDATLLEVRWTSWNLDVYIYVWCLDGAGMQFWGPGSRWGTHVETCMGLRWCSDAAEMQFCGSEWRWDITEMEVKRKCRDLYWAETWSGWRDLNLGVCLEVRWKSWDPVGVRWDMNWAETLMLRPGYIVMGLGNICDSFEARHVLDCGEIQIMRPG